MTTKSLFLVLLTVSFVYDMVLYGLAAVQQKKPLPASVRDIYPPAEYERWKSYTFERKRAAIVEKIFDFLVLLVLYGTNLLSAWYNLLPGGVYLRSCLLMTGYVLLLTLLTVPFDWVRDMVIEEKYGFNRTTPRVFAADQVKGFLITAILYDGLVCLTLFLYGTFGAVSFLAVYLVMAVFTLVFSMLSTKFQKLYNTFTPLEDGELRDMLTKLFAEAGYQLSDIEVMDASKRTTRSNAFCSGLGKFKKIVLFDNLLRGNSNREIAAVFAHELGHYKHRDTVKLTGCSLLMMGALTAGLAALVLNEGVSLAYGFAEPTVVFAVLALISVVVEPVMTLLAIPVNLLSRQCEYRADRNAVEAGYGPELVSALKKLSRSNLSDLNPHPFLVWMEDNHPTLAQRMEAIERERNGGRA